MGRKKRSRVSGQGSEGNAEGEGGRGGEEETSGAGESSTPRDMSLYEILGVERTVSQQEIKKAYYKLALRLHPDKNPGDEEAKEKFQQLQKVISILGDEEKRAVYDETGYAGDDALVGEAAENLQEFFRTMYKRVTEADIEEFEANYRGSDSEKKDLKDLYEKFKGNMNRLFCSMLCSDPKLDSHRYKDIIDEAIAEGELKTSRTYQKWAKKVSESEPPTNPVVRRQKKCRTKKQEGADIVAIISQRRSQRKQQFDSILSSIVAKCDARTEPEPTEEEFQKARQRLESKQTKNRKRTSIGTCANWFLISSSIDVFLLLFCQPLICEKDCGLLVILSNAPNLKMIGSLQGFAAGLMMSMSFFDLAHNAMNSLGFFRGNIWFFVGVLFFASVVNFIPEPSVPGTCKEDGDGSVKDMIRKHHRQVLFSGIVTAVVAGITVHNFPEGMAVFIGTTKGLRIGITFALAIALHNIPEGVAVALPVYYATESKWQAFKLAALSGFAEPLGVIIIAYLFPRNLNPEILEGLLGSVAGVMAFLTLHEMLPIAFDNAGHKQAVQALFLGMAFMSASLYFLDISLPKEMRL
ncbi:unnamed protein product [Musa acuminata subsp. burmannicoides]